MFSSLIQAISLLGTFSLWQWIIFIIIAMLIIERKTIRSLVVWM
jgi:hypothetical protein